MFEDGRAVSGLKDVAGLKHLEWEPSWLAGCAVMSKLVRYSCGYMVTLRPGTKLLSPEVRQQNVLPANP